MIAIDTETTSAWWSHGAKVFAIGSYTPGDKFECTVQPVNPLTRSVEFTPDQVAQWRDKLFSHQIWVMHNAQFDMRALHQMGVITETELRSDDLWQQRVLDTTVLSHLFNNKDRRSLKYLAKKYCESIDYAEEAELDRIVQRCRIFVSNRHSDWLIADARRRHPSLTPAAEAGTRWLKMDMWLPAALFAHYHTTPTRYSTLLNYFGEADTGLLSDCLVKYLRQDCEATYELAGGFLGSLLSEHGDHLDELIKVNSGAQAAICNMQMNGAHLHLDRLEDAIKTCKSQSYRLLASCKTLANTPSDGKSFTDTEVRTLLYSTWNLPVIKRTDNAGVPSVDNDTVTKLRRETVPGTVPYAFLGGFIAYKKYVKKCQALEGYLRKQKKSTLFPSYNVVGTDTLRMSSKDPNGQNIEKAQKPFSDPDINAIMDAAPSPRGVFGPGKGRIWLCADYSQLQLRIFACATDDKDMQKAFDNGWDGHEYTTRKIFTIPDDVDPTESQRRIGKNVNFGFIFGAAPHTIEQTAGIPGLWDTVMQMFPKAHDYIMRTKLEIKKKGRVNTLNGYPLGIPIYQNKYRPGVYEYKAHAGVNYIVQGTEGEVVKKAMAECHSYLHNKSGIDGFITLQVHDEFIFDLPEACPAIVAAHLKNLMENASNITTPVDMEVVTTTWKQKQKIKIPKLNPNQLKQRTILSLCTI